MSASYSNKHTQAVLAFVEQRWNERRRGCRLGDIAAAVGISTANAQNALYPLMREQKVDRVLVRNHGTSGPREQWVYFPAEQEATEEQAA